MNLNQLNNFQITISADPGTELPLDPVDAVVRCFKRITPPVHIHGVGPSTISLTTDLETVKAVLLALGIETT